MLSCGKELLYFIGYYISPEQHYWYNITPSSGVV
jgi:hypothetical protein